MREIKREPFKSEIYELYFNIILIQRKEKFSFLRKVVIQRGEADYTIKIEKRKVKTKGLSSAGERLPYKQEVIVQIL